MNILENIITDVTNSLGYTVDSMTVIKSNRPDLCDYQCDQVFKLAKQYHKNPMEIGEEITHKINELENFNDYFEKVEFVRPGFINITLSNNFINNKLKNMYNNPKFDIKLPSVKETYFMDYGGPNVAKPLHVGHLRPAIIGESVKRIHKFFENKTIGDVHLGDWGLQMGLVIEELKVRHPDWDYFNENFNGEYPEDNLFTVSDLEEIYKIELIKKTNGFYIIKAKTD